MDQWGSSNPSIIIPTTKIDQSIIRDKKLGPLFGGPSQQGCPDGALRFEGRRGKGKHKLP